MYEEFVLTGVLVFVIGYIVDMISTEAIYKKNRKFFFRNETFEGLKMRIRKQGLEAIRLILFSPEYYNSFFIVFIGCVLLFYFGFKIPLMVTLSIPLFLEGINHTLAGGMNFLQLPFIRRDRHA